MDRGGDDDDFPEDSDVGKKFALFDEQLQCPVCRDFFDNPHSLRCGHSFCSGCIRRHLDPLINKINADTCPLCKAKAESFDLRPNTVLGSVVSHYQGVRPDALSLVRIGVASAGSGDGDVVYAGSSSSSGAQSMGTAITERMTLCSFHGLKRDKVKEQLVKVCGASKVKLRLDGEKEALEKRLRNFIHLCNAQIGSLRPLTLEQVIRKVTEDEALSEKEAYKAARSAGKIERVKNGEVVKEFEDRFAALARQLRQQKEAAKKRNTASSTDGNSSTAISVLSQSAGTGSADATGAKTVESEGENEEPARSVLESEVAQSAQLLLTVERLLQSGFDFAPWRVLVSERLARPFFYNSETRVGQFAVPAELADILADPEVTERRATASANQVAEVAAVDTGSQARRGSQRSQEDGGHTASEQPRSQRSRNSQSSQQNGGSSNAGGIGASRRSTRGSARIHNSGGTDLAEEPDEESPFHMLVEGSQAQATGRGASQEAFHALTSSSSTGTSSEFTYTAAHTAASTARELPLPTPHPLAGARAGIAARVFSCLSGEASSAESDTGDGDTGGAGYPHSAQSRAHSGEQLSGDEDGVETGEVEATAIVGASSSSSSSTDHWACTVCTYHNNMITHTCEMCGTVDKAMQGRVTTPWLRSSSSSSSNGRISSSQSAASQRKRPSSQSTQSSSKKPKRR